MSLQVGVLALETLKQPKGDARAPGRRRGAISRCRDSAYFGAATTDPYAGDRIARHFLCCLFVCPSTWCRRRPTARRSDSGAAPFDSADRGNDDDVGRGSIGGTWHVARAAPWTSAKTGCQALQVKRPAAQRRHSLTVCASPWHIILLLVANPSGSKVTR